MVLEPFTAQGLGGRPILGAGIAQLANFADEQYFRRTRMLVDCVKTSNWFNVTGGPNPSYSGAGWPAGDFDILFAGFIIPAGFSGPSDPGDYGTYKVRGVFPNNPTVSTSTLAFVNSLQPAAIQNTRYVGGVFTCDLVVNATTATDGARLGLNFSGTGLTAASPPVELQIFRPAQFTDGVQRTPGGPPLTPFSPPQGATSWFTSAIKEQLRSFQGLRLGNANWGGVDFRDVSWSGRQPVSYAQWGFCFGNPLGTAADLAAMNANAKSYFLATQLGVNGNHGMAFPWEVAIQLCNELQKDFWITVPDAADSNYVTQLFTLIQQNLNPNLNLYPEDSNERWNSAFIAWNEGIAAGVRGVNTGTASILNYSGTLDQPSAAWALRTAFTGTTSVKNFVTTGLTGTQVTGASGGTGLVIGQQYRWVVTSGNLAGYLNQTLPSNEFTATMGAGNQTMRLTWDAVTGEVAGNWNVWRTAAGGAAGTEQYIGTIQNYGGNSSGVITFYDNGLALLGGAPPTSDTSSIAQITQTGATFLTANYVGNNAGAAPAFPWGQGSTPTRTSGAYDGTGPAILNWIASTAYTCGQITYNGLNIYTCANNGTSAGSGGPTGTGTGIVDNTVRWDFVATVANNPTTNFVNITVTGFNTNGPNNWDYGNALCYTTGGVASQTTMLSYAPISLGWYGGLLNATITSLVATETNVANVTVNGMRPTNLGLNNTQVLGQRWHAYRTKALADTAFTVFESAQPGSFARRVRVILPGQVASPSFTCDVHDALWSAGQAQLGWPAMAARIWAFAAAPYASAASPDGSIYFFEYQMNTTSVVRTAPIGKPTQNAITGSAGGSLVTGTPYYYVILAGNQVGKTQISAERAFTPGGGNNTANLSWAAVTGATDYWILRSLIIGGGSGPGSGYDFLKRITGTSTTDDGTVPVIPYNGNRSNVDTTRKTTVTIGTEGYQRLTQFDGGVADNSTPINYAFGASGYATTAQLAAGSVTRGADGQTVTVTSRIPCRFTPGEIISFPRGEPDFLGSDDTGVDITVATVPYDNIFTFIQPGRPNVSNVTPLTFTQKAQLEISSQSSPFTYSDPQFPVFSVQTFGNQFQLDPRDEKRIVALSVTSFAYPDITGTVDNTSPASSPLYGMVMSTLFEWMESSLIGPAAAGNNPAFIARANARGIHAAMYEYGFDNWDSQFTNGPLSIAWVYTQRIITQVTKQIQHFISYLFELGTWFISGASPYGAPQYTVHPTRQWMLEPDTPRELGIQAALAGSLPPLLGGLAVPGELDARNVNMQQKTVYTPFSSPLIQGALTGPSSYSLPVGGFYDFVCRAQTAGPYTVIVSCGVFAGTGRTLSCRANDNSNNSLGTVAIPQTTNTAAGGAQGTMVDVNLGTVTLKQGFNGIRLTCGPNPQEQDIWIHSLSVVAAGASAPSPRIPWYYDPQLFSVGPMSFTIGGGTTLVAGDWNIGFSAAAGFSRTPLMFMVDNNPRALNNLTMTATSSNTVVLPNSAVTVNKSDTQFAGGNGSRIGIVIAAGQATIGTCRLNLLLTDSGNPGNPQALSLLVTVTA